MQLLTYSHLFMSSPKFVMSHTVKGKDFSIVDKIEVAIFLEFSCFLYDPANVSNLISGSFSFSKPSLDKTESLCCTSETNATLQINYTPIKLKLFLKKRKDSWMDRWMDGWLNEWLDEWMDGLYSWKYCMVYIWRGKT